MVTCRRYIDEYKIKEELCVKFFETCIMLQDACDTPFHNESYPVVSYKEVMPIMHIGRDRFQRLLNSITLNWVYFKLTYGYDIIGTNIVSSIDWSKRFFLFGKPVYHFHVNKIGLIK